ncbi:DUF748 domain-containing protein [soil metagenome]
MFWHRKNNPASTTAEKPVKRGLWRMLRIAILIIVIGLFTARLMLPSTLRWYVNRTLDRSPNFIGKIGDVHVHLWRGAYSIDDITLSKTTGNIPVPLFSATQVDFSIQWAALMHGRVVGQIDMQAPQLNFVDAPDESDSQTGAGAPWLAILKDLFPFDINSAAIHNGSVHFRAFHTDPPVDVYVDDLQATIQNLSNITNTTAPLLATVTAQGLAMDHAKFEYKMKLDPNAYKPTFELAVRLIGLDVTKINSLSRAYGEFDFEKGWFDLVIELDAKAGGVQGYVRPLFRSLQIIGKQDIKEDNILGVFWEALVGSVAKVLTNPPRDQFGTEIPITGNLSSPNANIFATVGNVLRNAFVRAYLPKLKGAAPDIGDITFGRGSVTDPGAPGDDRN